MANKYGLPQARENIIPYKITTVYFFKSLGISDNLNNNITALSFVTRSDSILIVPPHHFSRLYTITNLYIPTINKEPHFRFIVHYGPIKNPAISPPKISFYFFVRNHTMFIIPLLGLSTMICVRHFEVGLQLILQKGPTLIFITF